MKELSITEPLNDIEQQIKRMGARIRELRKHQEPNYLRWSEQHGVNKVSLLRLENGENFTMKSLLTILMKLGVSYQEFNQGL